MFLLYGCWKPNDSQMAACECGIGGQVATGGIHSRAQRTLSFQFIYYQHRSHLLQEASLSPLPPPMRRLLCAPRMHSPFMAQTTQLHSVHHHSTVCSPHYILCSFEARRVSYSYSVPSPAIWGGGQEMFTKDVKNIHHWARLPSHWAVA